MPQIATKEALLALALAPARADYVRTRNAVYVQRAIQLATEAGAAYPQWVREYLATGAAEILQGAEADVALGLRPPRGSRSKMNDAADHDRDERIVDLILTLREERTWQVRDAANVALRAWRTSNGKMVLAQEKPAPGAVEIPQQIPGLSADAAFEVAAERFDLSLDRVKKIYYRAMARDKELRRQFR